jgi:short-subunit dehydrogenase
MTRPLALVTGGSAGIGLELARLLAKDGHDLVVTGASDRVASAAEELRQLGGEVIPVRSALSAEEGTAAVLDAVAAAGRPLDVAVLNAGIAVGGAFVDIPLERHLQLIALDVLSPVRMAHRLIPEMVANGGGKVLLVSSLSATTPTPYEEAKGNSVVAAGTLVPDELTGDVRYTVAFPQSFNPA